jgi:mannosyl-oligosaccharide glucosidase
MKALTDRARDVITPYQDPSKGLPDPSFVLQLPDEVYTGSNLYAIQKSFDGGFQFDIFFESGSSKQKLSCMFAYSSASHLIKRKVLCSINT